MLEILGKCYKYTTSRAYSFPAFFWRVGTGKVLVNSNFSSLNSEVLVSENERMLVHIAIFKKGDFWNLFLFNDKVNIKTVSTLFCDENTCKSDTDIKARLVTLLVLPLTFVQGKNLISESVTYIDQIRSILECFGFFVEVVLQQR